MTLQPHLNGELVIPGTVSIPADIEELEAQLTGLARLATASEWARAAIVAAWVEVKDGPGQPKSIVNTDNTLESTVDFAARGFAGLTSPVTVRLYAKAWLDRYPRPGRGTTSDLPDEPFPSNGNTHVSNNSGENEWYTPGPYLEAARRVLGGFDLDPASSDIAQRLVQADRYFTAETDGLASDWGDAATVWMNPPYAQPLVGRFVDKLVAHMRPGRAAVVLVNNATETAWGQALLTGCSAVCFPEKRLRFLDPDGNPGAPLQGQMLTYFGPEPGMFDDAFDGFGPVLHG